MKTIHQSNGEVIVVLTTSEMLDVSAALNSAKETAISESWRKRLQVLRDGFTEWGLD